MEGVTGKQWLLEGLKGAVLATGPARGAFLIFLCSFFVYEQGPVCWVPPPLRPGTHSSWSSLSAQGGKG